MKKNLEFLLSVATVLTLSSCNSNKTLVVYTESGFAPFEYVKDGEIVGVDVDIMNEVGKKLNMTVKFENVAFDTIVDTVSQGKLTKVGAAGISITDERKEKVDFSHVYYQANLYVIYNVNNVSTEFSKTMSDGNTGVYWQSLNSNKGIGIQTGTTADLFLGDEIGEGGSLEGVKKTDYTSLDVAVSDIGLNIDYVVIDELPAKKLAEGKSNLNCLPLYYAGGEGEADEIAYDEYAICVTKGEDKILNAINEVLDELLNKKENEVNGIQALVNKHLGI